VADVGVQVHCMSIRVAFYNGSKGLNGFMRLRVKE
jgi:hypothetical protein